MRRPTKEDFEATAQGTSIEVRFKPTNSIFLFAILADLDDVVAFGPVGPDTVRHGGPTGDLDSYSAAADEVFAIAHEVARGAVLRHESRRL
jgi:hypothetical protein